MKARVALALLLLLGWAVPARSQGCAMCYSSAQAASKDGQRAITGGVLVLLLPSLALMITGIWMACRYARKRDREQMGKGESLGFRESRTQSKRICSAAQWIHRPLDL